MRRCLTCRTRKKGLTRATNPSESLLSTIIACSEDWDGDSCSICIGLHIPCVGEGRKPPTWQKNVVLLTFCRKIISDQVKKRRRRRSRNHRCSRSAPSVRELVIALINTLSALYHFNHVDYDHDFCAITFLDETTQGVGIPTMEFLVKDIASRLGFPLCASAPEASGSPDSGINNLPNVATPQLSLVPTPIPITNHSFSQLLPNSVYGADSYHQASISSSLIGYPYNITHADSDLGSEGPSTYMGYIGGDQNVGVAYQSAPSHRY